MRRSQDSNAYGKRLRESSLPLLGLLVKEILQQAHVLLLLASMHKHIRSQAACHAIPCYSIVNLVNWKETQQQDFARGFHFICQGNATPLKVIEQENPCKGALLPGSASRPEAELQRELSFEVKSI